MALSYDQNLKREYPAIPHNLVQHGLMDNLNIIPAKLKGALRREKEQFIRQMGQPANHAEFETESGYLTGIHLKYEGRGSKPEDILVK